MKKLVLAISLFVTIVANCDSAKACTAAVVAAKASSEGGTILWKNRDSAFHSTIIQYIESEKYSYLGVVSISKPEGGVLAGVNEKGFGIVNTATLNLPKTQTSSLIMKIWALPFHLMKKVSY